MCKQHQSNNFNKIQFMMSDEAKRIICFYYKQIPNLKKTCLK